MTSVAKTKVAWLMPAIFVLAIAGLATWANLLGHNFTSDDVAQQAMLHDLSKPGPHHLLQGSDTYILKFPLYWLFDRFSQAGRSQVLGETSVLIGIMFGLLLVWWRIVTRRYKYSWLGFGWLASAGVYWLVEMVDTNTRSMELPIMLLVAVLMLHARSIRYKTWQVLAVSPLCGLLIYNDPYFLYFVLVPLLLAVGWTYWRPKPRFVLTAVLFMVCSLVTYKLFEAIFAHFHFDISSFNQLQSNLLAVTPPADWPRKAVGAFGAFCSLIGVKGFSLASLANLGVLGIAAAGLWQLLRSRTEQIQLLGRWIVLTLFLCTLFVTLVLKPNDAIVRYFIILVPLTAICVAYGLQTIKRAGKYLPLALGVVVAAAVLNVAKAADMVYHQSQVRSPNQLDYQIIATLKANGVQQAYGDYWLATISYYLGDYQANILPTKCVQGQSLRLPLLIDAQRFATRSRPTGIIVDPGLQVTAYRPFPRVTTCTLARAEAQFGRPQKTVPVSPDVELLIYTSDPFNPGAH